eukprot:34769_1
MEALRNHIISRHTCLMQQLESEYRNYINELLKRKELLMIQMQKDFYKELHTLSHYQNHTQTGIEPIQTIANDTYTAVSTGDTLQQMGSDHHNEQKQSSQRTEYKSIRNNNNVNDCTNHHNEPKQSSPQVANKRKRRRHNDNSTASYGYSTCPKRHTLSYTNINKLQGFYALRYPLEEDVRVACDLCKIVLKNGTGGFHCDQCEFDKCKDCWNHEKNEDGEAFTVKIKTNTANSMNPRRSSRISK